MNRINKIFALFALSVSMMVITSCDKKEDVDDGKTGTFTRMSIEDAKTLFIVSSGVGSKMYGVKNSSLKSTSEMDGEIYEISYLDEDGNPVERNKPDFIVDVEDFVYIAFSSDLYLLAETYFVKKSNGLVYPVPNEFRLPIRSSYEQRHRLFRSFGLIQFDKNKNIYFSCPSSVGKPGLYQVSSIESAIQFTEVSGMDGNSTGFCVDDDGQIVFTYRPDDGGPLDYVRCRKSDGDFVNMDKDDYNTHTIIYFWKGKVGLLYGFLRMRTNTGSGVGFIKIREGQISIIRDDANSNILSASSESSARNIFKVQERIIFCIQGYLIDISDEFSYKETLCSVRPNMVVNDQLCYFDDQAFSCTLVNIDSGETSLLYDLDESKLNNYKIDKIMSVSDSGVTFSAVDLSNGNYVVAKIDLENVVTVQQTIEGEVTVVIPLNP